MNGILNAQATCEERLAIRQSLPDLLDPATWPTGDAEAIIGRVAMEAQRYHDPLERLAREVGMLRSEVRKLVPEPLKLPKGSFCCEAEIEGLGDCTICYDYSPGRHGVHTMPNGDPGYPDDPAELYVTVVQIGSCEFDAEVFSEAVKEDLTAAAELDCERTCEAEAAERYDPPETDDLFASRAAADWFAERTAA